MMNMIDLEFTPQHDMVLNAIDLISSRKNRPNIARIYRHLVRFHSITSATCAKLLDDLVEQGRVVKVTYKGNISYRNLAKWKNSKTMKKSDPSKKTSAERRVSSLFSGTVAELAVRVPAYFRTGVPCKVLEDHLLAKDGRFTKESIHKLLQKELQLKTLTQLDNGNYFLAMNSNDSMNSSTIQDLEDSQNLPESEEEKSEFNKDDTDVIEINEKLTEDDDEEVGEENYDDLGDDDEVEEEEDDDGDDDQDQDEMEDDECVEEELEEEEDEEKTVEAMKEGIKAHSQDFSAESDDESGVNDSLHQDQDYLPPRKLSISTRRSSSGRLSVRNKKTRYDASEYFFPSLNKRSYKTRQEKSAISKQERKNRSLLSAKEFKKALLNPVNSFNNASIPSPIKKSITATLEKNRLPEIPLKSVQFGSANTFNALICTICNDNEVLVTKTSGAKCEICKRRAHTICIKSEQSLSKLHLETANWTCASCRFIIAQPCCVCDQTSSKTGPLVICGTCMLSYHRSCHQPPIPREKNLTGQWRCSNCTQAIKPQESGGNFNALPKMRTITSRRINEENDTSDIKSEKFEEVSIDEIKEKTIISNKGSFPNLRDKHVSLIKIDDSCATRPQQNRNQQCSNSQSPPTITPSSSPPSSQFTADDCPIKEEKDEDMHSLTTKVIKEEGPKDIPDASMWTSNDVYNYFKDAFNESVAAAFLKQEIDGNSLSLLRRSDVLRGLGFKLGVGLNVLYHVKMLQLKTSDLKTIWAAAE